MKGAIIRAELGLAASHADFPGLRLTVFIVVLSELCPRLSVVRSGG